VVRHHLRQRLSALVIAGTMASLVERLTHPGASDANVYLLLKELLDFLDTMPVEPSMERARLFMASITLRLLDTLGYALRLDQCTSCQRMLSEPIWFLPAAGGMVCEACMTEKRHQFAQAVRLPDQTVRLLRFVRQSDLHVLSRLTVSTHLLHAVGAVVDGCAEHHAPLLSKRPYHHNSLSLLQMI